MTAQPKRRRSERLEVRTTPADRALIDRAVESSGVDLTEFVVSNLTIAAQRVLADRTEFQLAPASWEAWETINHRPAKDLVGLRDLMDRPSPFTDE